MSGYKSKNGYDGLLIVIEGTDGSGKSTQIGRLKRWIEDQSYGVMVSEWKTSKFIADAINDAKERNLLNATTFSLLYAAESFLYRDCRPGLFICGAVCGGNPFCASGPNGTLCRVDSDNPNIAGVSGGMSV